MAFVMALILPLRPPLKLQAMLLPCTAAWMVGPHQAGQLPEFLLQHLGGAHGHR